MRNRAVGRTFIEGNNRADRVRLKYTPLREVLKDKKVILVEDSIVRSTTMQGLLSHVRELGGAREIHVRVACPPIIAPCFYGIDMSTVDQLFAPKFMKSNKLTMAEQDAMARELRRIHCCTCRSRPSPDVLELRRIDFARLVLPEIIPPPPAPDSTNSDCSRRAIPTARGDTNVSVQTATESRLLKSAMSTK